MSSNATNLDIRSSPSHRWLWCDDHAAVNDWFVTRTIDRKMFYGSFINYCNRLLELLHNDAARELQDDEQQIHDCLLNDPIPADALIGALDWYCNYIGNGNGGFKERGLVNLNNDPSDATLDAAAVRLHDKAFPDHSARAERKRNRKIYMHKRAGKRRSEKRYADRIARENAAMADQKALPDGLPPSLLSAAPLSLVEQSLSDAIPVASTQQQTPMEHGALVVRSGKTLGEVDKNEDEDMD